MGAQPRRIAAVASCGHAFDLLVTDVDVVWRRAPPWPILDAPRRRHCEVQAIAAAAPASSSRYWDESIRVSLSHPQANIQLNGKYFERLAGWVVALDGDSVGAVP